MTKPTRSAISEARAAAWAANQTTFIVPDQPCANGHINARRYTSSGICVSCSAEYRSKTPKAERILRLPRTDTRAIQLYQDPATASLRDDLGKRFAELTGRPVSQNLLYRAAMRALAIFLHNAS